jgi:hypothetical protein
VTIEGADAAPAVDAGFPALPPILAGIENSSTTFGVVGALASVVAVLVAVSIAAVAVGSVIRWL